MDNVVLLAIVASATGVMLAIVKGMYRMRCSWLRCGNGCEVVLDTTVENVEEMKFGDVEGK